MRRIVTILALGPAALSAVPASARDGAWYVGGDFGTMIVEDIDYDIGPTQEAAIADHHAGFDLDGVVGHDFGGYRLEAEIAYREAGVSGYASSLPTPHVNDQGQVIGDYAPGQYDYAGGTDSALSFMLNGMLDFGDDDGISGFVGGGVGVARVKSELALSTNSDFLDDSDTVFAWQMIAGLRAPLSDSIDFSFKYRFFNADTVRLTDVVGREYEGRFRSHSVLGGLVFNFGAPESGPAERFEDFAQRQRDKEQAANRRHVELHGGYGRTGIPRTNYGFFSDGPVPAPDIPAAYSRKWLDGLTIGGNARFGGLGTFGFDYAEGKGSTATDLPVGAAGTRRGYPYTARSPSGSTGIGGNIGIGITTDTAMEEYRAYWGFRFGGEPPQDLSGPSVAPTIGIDATFRNRDHLGIVSIVTPVIATQRLDQDVKEREFGISAGVDVQIPVGLGMKLGFGVEGGPFHYDYDLKSRETNTQNFGPAADRAFTTELQRSISGVGFRAGANIALEIEAGNNWDLFLRGSAGYSSARAQVKNPVGGTAVQNGSAADIYFAEAYFTRFAVGARFKF